MLLVIQLHLDMIWKFARFLYIFAMIHESAAGISAGFLINCHEAAAAKCFL